VEGRTQRWKGIDFSAGGVLNNTPYSFTTRFENAPGTNPEELIAGCTCGMLFDGAVGATGRCEPSSREHFDERDVDDGEAGFGWTITASHIDVVGKVPGADAATFQKYAEAAEKGCPVSRS